ncbi:MAG TPA: branched-chain amino acid ABC transporter permease [Ruminiclostridium sp.]|nr:branched-chain amino acid ABC transporter permease [Ruminiclostridium sp.]
MTVAILFQLILNGLAMGIIYALPALGISLIWNASGLFNFAQGDLLTLGGYIMLTVFGKLNIPFIPAFMITVAAMGLLGYALSQIYFYPMLENKVNPQIILIGTVAFSVFIRNLVLVIWGTTPQTYTNPFGSQVMQIGELYLMPHVIWIVAIVTVLLSLLQYFLRSTMVGIAMRAVAQRQTASWLMGIRNDRMIALTFLLSTSIAAVSGVLISPILPLTPSMGGMIAVKAMAAVLIGGLGSFSGALIGGVAVGIAETIFAAIVDPAYRDIFIFGILVLFLLFRPGGIFKAQVSEKV